MNVSSFFLSLRRSFCFDTFHFLTLTHILFDSIMNNTKLIRQLSDEGLALFRRSMSCDEVEERKMFNVGDVVMVIRLRTQISQLN